MSNDIQAGINLKKSGKVVYPKTNKAVSETYPKLPPNVEQTQNPLAAKSPQASNATGLRWTKNKPKTTHKATTHESEKPALAIPDIDSVIIAAGGVDSGELGSLLNKGKLQQQIDALIDSLPPNLAQSVRDYLEQHIQTKSHNANIAGLARNAVSRLTLKLRGAGKIVDQCRALTEKKAFLQWRDEFQRVIEQEERTHILLA